MKTAAIIIAAIFHFMEIMVICIAALVALFFVLMALPKSQLRDFMMGLTQRVGATAAAVALVPPMDAIPVTGEIYDLLALAGVVWYWYTFFQKSKTEPETPPYPIHRLPPAK